MASETKTIWPGGVPDAATEPGPGMVQGIGMDGEQIWLPADKVGREWTATKAAMDGMESRIRYLEQAELTRRRSEEQAAQDAANSNLGRAVRAVGGDIGTDD